MACRAHIRPNDTSMRGTKMYAPSKLKSFLIAITLATATPPPETCYGNLSREMATADPEFVAYMRTQNLTAEQATDVAEKLSLSGRSTLGLTLSGYLQHQRHRHVPLVERPGGLADTRQYIRSLAARVR